MAKKTVQIYKCQCKECGWTLCSTIKTPKTYEITNKKGIVHTISRFESGRITILKHG